jgi:hypothetical protein
MSASIRFASAPADHRLDVGDGQTMLREAKFGLCSAQPLLCAHTISCPIGALPAAHRLTNLTRIAPNTSPPTGRNSNPHSHTPLFASYQTARGFLPRGLSDAYRRPR